MICQCSSVIDFFIMRLIKLNDDENNYNSNATWLGHQIDPSFIFFYIHDILFISVIFIL